MRPSLLIENTVLAVGGDKRRFGMEEVRMHILSAHHRALQLGRFSHADADFDTRRLR